MFDRREPEFGDEREPEWDECTNPYRDKATVTCRSCGAEIGDAEECSCRHSDTGCEDYHPTSCGDEG